MGIISMPCSTLDSRAVAALDTVLIVSDVRLYRDGLALCLAKGSRFEVVGADDTAEAALAHVVRLRPSVVLLDHALPHALDLVRALRLTAPGVKVVALAVAELDHDILACMEAGAAGYVPRDGSVDDLIGTLESVCHGELRCSPRIAGSLSRRLATLAARSGGDVVAAEANRLTPREREIVGLVGQGLTNKEIAVQLGIEVATVKNHVHKILEKLRVRRRAEIGSLMRRGWLAPRARIRAVEPSLNPPTYIAIPTPLPVAP